MDLQGASGAASTSAALELAALKLAKNQQEQEGQAALGLLASAAEVAPPASSANPALGGQIDTYA